MRIGERVFHMLEQSGQTQRELADYLGIAFSTVNGWRQANRNPSSELISPICEFFSVTTDYLLTGKMRASGPSSLEELPFTEQKMLDTFQQLNEANKHYILSKTIYQLGRQKRSEQWDEQHPGAVEALLLKSLPQETEDNVAYMNFANNLPVDRKDMAVFFQPAAAGTGTFLDSDDYDMIDVPINPVTIRASFGVRVSGDSMEPEYDDEDIVFVKQQRTLDSGEIGIFILNGDAFIKKLVKTKNKYQLVSLNPLYKPIEVRDEDELRVVGKVIGKHIDE